MRFKTISISILILLTLCGCASKQAGAPNAVSEYKDGEGRFSFSYPTQYIIADPYLWVESRYTWHLNNPQINDERHIPDIKIITDSLNGKTLDEYVAGLYGTSDFEHEKINGRDFIKIKQTLLITELAYYTANNDLVVGFRDMDYDDWDEKDLVGILETLEF